MDSYAMKKYSIKKGIEYRIGWKIYKINKRRWSEKLIRYHDFGI